MDIQEQTNVLYDEQNKLYDALEVIRKYEDGDLRSLKQKIRARIDEIEAECDRLMGVKA